MAATKTAWQYKVVKQGRGMRGEWFDYRTAATFVAEADARAYAESFAAEQAGVAGVRIVVRSRRARAGGLYVVATYVP